MFFFQLSIVYFLQASTSSRLLEPRLLCSLKIVERHSSGPTHDRSQVPRVVDDREKRMHKVMDAGYVYRYHRRGIDPLPRVPDSQDAGKTPLFKPEYKVTC